MFRVVGVDIDEGETGELIADIRAVDAGLWRLGRDLVMTEPADGCRDSIQSRRGGRAHGAAGADRKSVV